MIELSLLAPPEFAATLEEVREAMRAAEHPQLPGIYLADRTFPPLFRLHHELEDYAILQGWAAST